MAKITQEKIFEELLQKIDESLGLHVEKSFQGAESMSHEQLDQLKASVASQLETSKGTIKGHIKELAKLDKSARDDALKALSEEMAPVIIHNINEGKATAEGITAAIEKCKNISSEKLNISTEPVSPTAEHIVNNAAEETLSHGEKAVNDIGLRIFDTSFKDSFTDAHKEELKKFVAGLELKEPLTEKQVTELVKTYNENHKGENPAESALKALKGGVEKIVQDAKDAAEKLTKQNGLADKLKGMLSKEGQDKWSDAHANTFREWLGDRTELTEAELEKAKNSMEEFLKKDTKAEKLGEELKKTLSSAVPEAGFWAKNFSKDIGKNWENTKGGMGKFGRVAGTCLGVVIAGHGLNKTFSKDEEGNSHPVAGLIETGAGAALAIGSLMKRGGGGPAVSA